MDINLKNASENENDGHSVKKSNIGEDSYIKNEQPGSDDKPSSSKFEETRNGKERKSVYRKFFRRVDLMFDRFSSENSQKKSENNDKRKRKTIVNILVFLLILAGSFTMILRYPFIEKNARESKVNPFENSEFVKNIYDTNYYLYHIFYEKENDKLIPASRLFLRNDTVDYIVNNLSLTYYAGTLTPEEVRMQFNSAFSNLGDFVTETNGKFKYMLLNTKTNYVMGNDNENIKIFSKSSADKSKEIESLKKKYQMFIIMNYNDDGNLSVTYTYGMSKKYLESEILNLISKEATEIQGDYSGNEDILYYKKEPIKNMAIIYGIPKDINTNFYNSTDRISEIINKNEREAYRLVFNMFYIVAAVIGIIALLIPHNISRGILTVKRVRSWFIELNIAWISVALSYLLGNNTPVKLVRNTINANLLKYVMSNDLPIRISKLITNMINIVYWFTIFYLVFLTVTLVKDLFMNGFLRCIRKKSLIYKLFMFLCRKIRKYFALDFSKAAARYVIAFLVLNYAGLLFLFTFVVGTDLISAMVILFVYTLVLIVLLKGIYRKIENNYRTVLEITRDVSEANFENDIEYVDVGVFEGLKNGLVDIQNGFEKSIEEEGRSQRLKSELISNVSHDLKTPLTSIITYIDLMKSSNATPEQKDMYLQTIERKAYRLRTLIEDLFEMSKATSGSVKLDLEELDLVSLVKQSVFEMEDKIENAQLTLKTRYPKDKIMLLLDGNRMFRVLENLIMNMCKYALKGSRVHINVYEDENNAYIELKNISAAEIDFMQAGDLMERFVRGDKSRNTEGSGLGLAIAKSFVELQGGTIEINVDADLFTVTITFEKNKNIIK